MGRGGSQSQAARSLRRQHRQRKKCSVEKSHPTPTVLGALGAQPGASVSLSIHMSVCAMEAFPQAWLGSEYVGSATSGKEGVEAWGVGMAGARLRAGGQPQLCTLVPTPLHVPYTELHSGTL